MSVTVLPSRVASVLARLSDALDAVAALDPDQVAWAEQEVLVRGLETAGRRLDAVRPRTRPTRRMTREYDGAG